MPACIDLVDEGTREYLHPFRVADGGQVGYPRASRMTLSTDIWVTEPHP